ncbi:hypothetical protein Emed_005428 [Eimeria media]
MEDGYDFEYESDGDAWGGEEEGAVLAENLYYEAQECMQTKPEKAVPLLEEVLQREAEASQKPWTFKQGAALSHLLLITRSCCSEALQLHRLSLIFCCCCCCCSGNYARAASEYRRLLSMLSSVAAGEGAAAIESVFLSAFKLAGLKQYDALPDVFAASPSQHPQQQSLKALASAQGGEATYPPSTANAEGGGGCSHVASQRPLPLSVSSDPGVIATAAGKALNEEGSNLLEELMLATLEALGSQGLKAILDLLLQRLRAQACSKLLRLYMQLGDWKKARALLPELHEADKDPALPPHQQLEAAATEVLCCCFTQDWQQLQQLLPHALRLASASLDPRSAAAVRECAARLLVELHVHPELQQHRLLQQHEQQTWAEIHGHLMAAFRHHQEIGDVRAARASLRRAVLIAPLAACVVDPFSTREGKALQVCPPPCLSSQGSLLLRVLLRCRCGSVLVLGCLSSLASLMAAVRMLRLLLLLLLLQGDPDVLSAKALRAAFEANDVAGVEAHLERLFVADPFAVYCGGSLLQAVRLKRLQAITSCYSAFPLGRLQRTLRLSEAETTRFLLQVLPLFAAAVALPLAAKSCCAPIHCCTWNGLPFRLFSFLLGAFRNLSAIHGGHVFASIDEEAQVLRVRVAPAAAAIAAQVRQPQDEHAESTNILLSRWCSSAQDLTTSLAALLEGSSQPAS